MTTHYPLVRFVSAPEVGAEVRFDFNSKGEWSDTEAWPEHEGFDLGAPSLEGEPDGIGTEYGFRQLSFNVLIKGRGSALRAQGELARELARRTNWLMFQFSPSSPPQWFKTYRSAPSSIDFELVYLDPPLFGVGVTLDADPFAVGEWETVGPVTITADPTVGANPMQYVFTDVKGDVPTPLVTTWAAHATDNDPFPVFSVMAGPDAAPIYIGSPDFLGGTDEANAAYIGDSVRRIVGSDSTTQPLTVTTPALPVGRYRVFARLGREDTDSQFTVGVASYQQGTYWGEWTQGTGTDSPITWLELGEFAFPSGAPAKSSLSAVPDLTHWIDVYARRLNGAGDLLFDGLLLVPTAALDHDAEAIKFPVDDFYDPGDVLGIDGVEERLTIEYSDGYRTQIGNETGGYPVVVPGYNNTATLIMYARPNDPFSNNVTDDKNRTWEVTFRYQPKYLYLAGD